MGPSINLTRHVLYYIVIPDQREEHHPCQELGCIANGYDAAKGTLTISVKETESNPFDGAELRHPVGSRRQATIAGKYTAAGYSATCLMARSACATMPTSTRIPTLRWAIL